MNDCTTALKEEHVKVITYEDHVEDWKCQYAVLDDTFLFLGGKMGGARVPREGREFPDRRTMLVFSSPIIRDSKFSE